MEKKGFTLIELLVVIAIIGILASIVLVSLGSARNKAKNARVQGDLSQVRSIAEMIIDDTGYYSDVCVASGTTLNLTDATYGTQFTTIHNDIAGPNGANASETCHAAATGATVYCVFSALNGTTDVYCIDSTGFAGQLTAAANLCSATVFKCK